eukprot:CAMPEP_0113489018 /NCGR_PEP_ID=MMETSP0014_2-20120614/26315_1 /TAXON_ID=2857 /ORGANISM="Nitzschia sp." /LENGTH=687 /DNA_ID=CAMNT_0000382747 /DNA_START=136 /DNA_END=2196 /DNA_ORIENTATION=+ /assembly_acc=CAM_ASM_000159
MTTVSEDHSSSNGDDSSSYKFSSSKLKKKGKKIKLRHDQPLKSGNAHKSASPSSSSASSKEKEKERHSSKDRKTDETPSSPVQKYIKMFENSQTSSTKHSPSATQATRTGSDTTPKPTARTPERSKASSSSSSRGPNTLSERRKKNQASPSSSSSSSPSYSPRSTPSSHPSSPSSRSSKQNSSSTSSSSNRIQKSRRKTSPQEQKYPSKIPKRGNNDKKKTTTAATTVTIYYCSDDGEKRYKKKTSYRDNDDRGGGGGGVGGDDMDWSEYVSEPLSAPAKIDTPPSPSASSADRAAGGGRQAATAAAAAAAAAVQVQLLDQKLGDLMVQHEDLRGSMMSPSSTRRNKNRPWHKEYTEASKAARSEKRVQRSSDSLSRSLHSSSYSSDSIRSMRSALSGTGLDVVMREVSDSDSGKSGSISSKSGLSNGSNSSSSSDDSEGRRTKGVYDRYRKYLNKDVTNKATPEKQTEDFQRLSTKLSAPPQLDFTYRYQGESTNVVEMKHVSNEVTAEQAASVMRKPSRSNTGDLGAKLGRLDRHLQSDTLPKDDLKMLGALLLQDSQSHMSFDDSTLGSDVHSHRTSERSAMRTPIGDPTSRLSSASLSDSLDPLVIEEDHEGEMSNRSSSNGGDDQIGQTSEVKAEKSFKEIYKDDEDDVTGSADNDHQFANASHLEGLNQPKQSEEDSGSIG